MTKPIGQIIYEYRKENGLSQKELATRLLISIKTLSRYERGHKHPSLIVIYVLRINKILV